jgi:2-methylcitrate dehydratase PrpD
MDASRDFADFTVELCFESLPDETVYAAKRLVLDTLGSTLAGTTAPGIETLHAPHAPCQRMGWQA